MKEEIIYGSIAMLAWSLYVILLKAVLKEAELKLAILFMGLGIFISSILTFLFLKETITNFNIKNAFLAFISGVLWFLGVFAVNYALRKGLNLSIMAPIYNMNTLLVVILSILLFHESVEIWKVILASILVVAAAILLS